MLNQQDFQGHYHTSEIALVAKFLVVPLSILNIVHGDHGLILLESARASTSELLHVGTDSQNVADVNAKGSHVGAGLTRDPEDAHVSFLIVVEELALVDGANTELLLDSRNQGRSLEDRPGQAQKSLLDLLDLVNMLMELNDGNVLFTRRLLSLNETSCVVDAGDEAASNLRI